MNSKSMEYGRTSRLLADRRVSGVAMLMIISVALLFGLIGFVVHMVWIASVVVLALGLGYVMANVRQNRREVEERDVDTKGREDVASGTFEQ
jgi:hypothetical protein